jgi:hypothetical protein
MYWLVEYCVKRLQYDWELRRAGPKHDMWLFSIFSYIIFFLTLNFLQINSYNLDCNIITFKSYFFCCYVLLKDFMEITETSERLCLFM